MVYRVKIEQFEGPLDLLLEIVEARRLSVVTLPLTEVAEQFLTYLRSRDVRDLEDITQFIVVASRLALLKSRELVPTLGDSLEAEGEIDTLTARLRRYHPYRQAAKKIEQLDRRGRQFWPRASFAGYAPIFYFPKSLTASTLGEHMKNVLGQMTHIYIIPQAKIRSLVSLEVCIENLLHLSQGKKPLNFSEYLNTQAEEERVVFFIGVLELMRMGKMSAQQKENFGTIVLTRLEEGEPVTAKRQ